MSAWTCPSPSPGATSTSRAALPGGEVLFSTRRGGVSEGPFASLNLGRLTDDPGENVDENRARLAAAVGAPRERFLYGRQVHEATVRRATEPPGPQRPHAPEDGQATALEDAPALVFVADCLPVMLVADGAVAALHGGWRGLAAGIVAEGVAALRELGAEGPIQAALGPSARGCCYEVGEEVHEVFERYDARVGERNLDLAKVARAQLEEAGVDEVHDVGLCSMCWFGAVLLPPPRRRRHRPAGGGRVAGLIHGVEVETCGAGSSACGPRSRRPRARPAAAPTRSSCSPPSSTSRSRTSTSSHEAGLTLLGENRAQELEAKATAHPEFRWHFIGQLQSRKVKQILPYVELIHSVASDSALNQLGKHGTPETEILVEVNVAGDEGKAGIDPDELPAFLERAPVRVSGPDDDAAVRRGSGGQPAPLRGPHASSPTPTA